MHCSRVPTHIHTFERLQALPIATVYPGHYKIFDQTRYDQIIGEYLEAKRHPGCPSDRIRLKSTV